MKKAGIFIFCIFLVAGIQAQEILSGDWSGECSLKGKEQMVLMALHENGAFSIVIGNSDLTPHPGTWSRKRNSLTISTPEGTIKLKQGPVKGDNPVWTFHAEDSSIVFEQVTPETDLPDWARGLKDIAVKKD